MIFPAIPSYSARRPSQRTWTFKLETIIQSARLDDSTGVLNGNMGVKPEVAWENPDKFLAPHSIAVDSEGDF